MGVCTTWNISRTALLCGWRHADNWEVGGQGHTSKQLVNSAKHKNNTHSRHACSGVVWAARYKNELSFVTNCTRVSRSTFYKTQLSSTVTKPWLASHACVASSTYIWLKCQYTCTLTYGWSASTHALLHMAEVPVHMHSYIWLKCQYTCTLTYGWSASTHAPLPALLQLDSRPRHGKKMQWVSKRKVATDILERTFTWQSLKHEQDSNRSFLQTYTPTKNESTPTEKGNVIESTNCANCM